MIMRKMRVRRKGYLGEGDGYCQGACTVHTRARAHYYAHHERVVQQTDMSSASCACSDKGEERWGEAAVKQVSPLPELQPRQLPLQGSVSQWTGVHGDVFSQVFVLLHVQLQSGHLMRNLSFFVSFFVSSSFS